MANAEAAGARSLAAHAVARVLREGVTLDAALQAALKAAPGALAPSVRSLELWRGPRLLPARGPPRPPVVAAGEIAGFPGARPAVGCAVRAGGCAHPRVRRGRCGGRVRRRRTDAARASGLINAVLRRYLRERKALDAEIARSPAARHASPVWLADRLRADWPVRWTQLLAAGDRAGADVAAGERATRRRPRNISRRFARVGDRRERRAARAAGACCWTRPATLPSCRDSPRAWCRFRTSARSASRFRSSSRPGQRVLDACAAPGRQDRAHRRARAAARRAGRASTSILKRLARVRENLDAGSLHAELSARRCGRIRAHGGTACRSIAFCSTRRVPRSA